MQKDDTESGYTSVFIRLRAEANRRPTKQIPIKGALRACSFVPGFASMSMLMSISFTEVLAFSVAPVEYEEHNRSSNERKNNDDSIKK